MSTETMNPYSAPQSSLEDAGVEDCWREGKIFVMRKDSLFPRRCVTCNDEAKKPVRSRRIYWLHPAWRLIIPVNVLPYLLMGRYPILIAFVLPNILLYLIVTAIVRKRAHIEPGLCEKHSRQRNLMLSIGGVLFVLSIALMLKTLPEGSGSAMRLAGVIGMPIAMIITAFGSRMPRPKRITENEIHLKGCGEPFLAGLAEKRPL